MKKHLTIIMWLAMTLAFQGCIYLDLNDAMY